jgi:hypothetical protein
VGYEVNAARAAMAAVVSHHSFGDGARELEGWLTLSLVDIKFFFSFQARMGASKNFLISLLDHLGWGFVMGMLMSRDIKHDFAACRGN